MSNREVLLLKIPRHVYVALESLSQRGKQPCVAQIKCVVDPQKKRKHVELTLSDECTDVPKKYKFGLDEKITEPIHLLAEDSTAINAKRSSVEVGYRATLQAEVTPEYNKFFMQQTRETNKPQSSIIRSDNNIINTASQQKK